MIRVPPLCAPRPWGGSNRSRPTTLRPLAARWYTAEAPMLPNPTTIASTRTASMLVVERIPTAEAVRPDGTVRPDSGDGPAGGATNPMEPARPDREEGSSGRYGLPPAPAAAATDPARVGCGADHLLLVLGLLLLATDRRRGEARLAQDRDRVGFAVALAVAEVVVVGPVLVHPVVGAGRTAGPGRGELAVDPALGVVVLDHRGAAGPRPGELGHAPREVVPDVVGVHLVRDPVLAGLGLPLPGRDPPVHDDRVTGGDARGDVLGQAPPAVDPDPQAGRVDPLLRLRVVAPRMGGHPERGDERVRGVGDALVRLVQHRSNDGEVRIEHSHSYVHPHWTLLDRSGHNDGGTAGRCQPPISSLWITN